MATGDCGDGTDEDAVLILLYIHGKLCGFHRGNFIQSNLNNRKKKRQRNQVTKALFIGGDQRQTTKLSGLISQCEISQLELKPFSSSPDIVLELAHDIHRHALPELFIELSELKADYINLQSIYS